MVDQFVGSLEDLMTAAAEGRLSKDELASLLNPGFRQPFLKACAVIEERYTEECAAQNDPCLESGCAVSVVEGEACLQPLLRVGTEYHKACAAEWIKVFRNPNARIEIWKD
ncbi:MAG: hypothetical protein HY047_11590 [Acidobacteria bacterium]|nr:hypothetical protein [Acidobacteriota bacterium]